MNKTEESTRIPLAAGRTPSRTWHTSHHSTACLPGMGESQKQNWPKRFQEEKETYINSCITTRNINQQFKIFYQGYNLLQLNLLIYKVQTISVSHKFPGNGRKTRDVPLSLISHGSSTLASNVREANKGKPPSSPALIQAHSPQTQGTFFSRSLPSSSLSIW